MHSTTVRKRVMTPSSRLVIEGTYHDWRRIAAPGHFSSSVKQPVAASSSFFSPQLRSVAASLANSGAGSPARSSPLHQLQTGSTAQNSSVPVRSRAAHSASRAVYIAVAAGFNGDLDTGEA